MSISKNNKMRKIIITIILVLLVLPFVRADMISRGQRYIQIENKILNVDDYSDYVFISVCKLGDEIAPYQGIKVIDKDNILPYYKFCSVSVYAIKKSDFDTDIIENPHENRNKIIEYLTSSKTKEVISGIRTSKVISDSSTVKSIENTYIIDLTQIKSQPDEQITERNILLLLSYIILPIISLLAIVILLRRRKCSY